MSTHMLPIYSIYSMHIYIIYMPHTCVYIYVYIQAIHVSSIVSMYPHISYMYLLDMAPI